MTGPTEQPARECAHENRVIDAEADVRRCVDCNATLPRTGVKGKPATRGVAWRLVAMTYALIVLGLLLLAVRGPPGAPRAVAFVGAIVVASWACFHVETFRIDWPEAP